MLMMKSPSLAINSCDVPGIKYEMWETVNAPSGMTPQALVNEIVRVNDIALRREKSQLLNVVINCHGYGGGLAVGGKDSLNVNITNVASFAALSGRNIGTIWIVACRAAAGIAGKQLCQTMATLSGCQVVAADESQEVGIWGSYRLTVGMKHQIDEFEGQLYSFTPVGQFSPIDPHSAIFTTLE
jgi:hypothetical protein